MLTLITAATGALVGATVGAATLQARWQRDPPARADALVEPASVQVMDALGVPLPGAGVYARTLRRLARASGGRMEAGHISEHWASDPMAEPTVEAPVLVEARIQDRWVHIEPKHAGAFVDLDTILADLNEALEDQPWRWVLLDRETKTVGLAECPGTRVPELRIPRVSAPTV